MGQATSLMPLELCEPDQAFREIGRRRGVEGVREQRPALRHLPNGSTFAQVVQDGVAWIQ
jgi:hypothetical protein